MCCQVLEIRLTNCISVSKTGQPAGFGVLNSICHRGDNDDVDVAMSQSGGDMPC